MSKKNCMIIGCFFLLIVSCKSTEYQEKIEWTGRYEYASTLGRTAGDSPIVDEIKLTIYKNDGRLQCSYFEDGMQTMVRMILNVSDRNNTLNLFFEKWGEEHSFPTFKYTKGERIITIEKKDENFVIKFLKDDYKKDTYIFKKIE